MEAILRGDRDRASSYSALMPARLAESDRRVRLALVARRAAGVRPIR